MQYSLKFGHAVFLFKGGKMENFLKCDLHLHSSTCYSRTYNENDFFEKIKSTEVDVISITDHNIIDTELYKKIISDSEINKKIILGVELNIVIDDVTKKIII